jgi:anthranilate phosphoribosyltransferase
MTVAAPTPSEFYAYVIKRLGRNAREGMHGVLDADEATRLWRDLLAGHFTPAQEAALLMGLRVHGESAAMLAAFVRVTRAACAKVRAPVGHVVVVLHCLGTARKQPILAPLLALSLARAGVATLMVTHDAQRGANTTAVLDALGEQPAADAAVASTVLAERGFAWITVDRIAPPLARLLDRRAELGFRNTAHSLIKLLVPVQGRAIVVANYTHAAYRHSFAQAAEQLQLSALLVRGTEGDPVAWETEAHPLLAWRDGVAVVLPAVMTDTTPEHLALPAAADIEATAGYCRSVLDRAQPMPAAIAREIACLAHLAA